MSESAVEKIYTFLIKSAVIGVSRDGRASAEPVRYRAAKLSQTEHFSAARKQCHIGQDSPTIYRQGYIIGSDIHLLNLHSVFVRILSKDGHSRLNDICKNSRFEKKIYPTKFNSTYIKNSTADDNSNSSGSG